MTDRPIEAANPARSASVMASAGSGKTWLLVTRLIRLLLAGVPPERILAVTFTRKAAGEMQERLHSRLHELLAADDATLDALLTRMDEQPGPDRRRRARGLYESLLRAPQPLRASTFHGFCQDILRRFPLEAGLPPGFELTESTQILYEESWDALFAEVSDFPESPLANDLEFLFDTCQSADSTRKSLLSFLEHRGDWWAYVQGESDPTDFAARRLERELEVDSDEDPALLFWGRATPAMLREFARLLGMHSTKANDEHRADLEQVLSTGDQSVASIARVRPVFMTKESERRKRKESNAQLTSMGTDGQRRFLELHDRLCSELECFDERTARRVTLALSTAWYRAGARLLDHFQRIKRERRLVDFADLEWKACELLNDADHAHWVQYKLDQRIDHLLVDEFQDTNPTQWRLLRPLLDQFGDDDQRRTLFLVGDPKQSIYGFRRGNPALLEIATGTMERLLDALRFSLEWSWRSSQTILDFVNQTFRHPILAAQLPGFPPHESRRGNLWGRVEVWPLFEEPAAATTPSPAALRNPLEVPRQLAEARCHYLEGRAIADHIRRLIEDGTLIGDDTDARRLNYDDVYVLLGTRTHLADYEAALRDCHIPCLSMDRGTLLTSLEVRDLEALLNLLMTPQDNLALAQVLRSPIFAVTDSELAELAQGVADTWYDRLLATATSLPPTRPLARAARLLEAWRALAGRVPIHDLLDRVYHESNLVARYESAFPASQRPRVRANLTRFVELALEVDAGRYPSLPHFLARLARLRGLPDDAPDQAPPDSATGRRVRIMTIHAAKGLEAPLVFLADGAHEPGSRDAWGALVRWPAEAPRPDRMLLASRKAMLDQRSRDWLAEREREQERESANQLYVALTRAKQMLVVSGCRPSKGAEYGWYGVIAAALGRDPDAFGEPFIQETGRRATVEHTAAPSAPASSAAVPALARKLVLSSRPIEIAPSHNDDDEAAEGTGGGRLRGIAIHRLLQLLGAHGAVTSPRIEDTVVRVAAELGWTPGGAEIDRCRDEALALLRDPDLSWLFEPAPGIRVCVETPLCYTTADGTGVAGVVDRLLIGPDTLWLVDFKSHRVADERTLETLTERYRGQMRLYHDGVARLWPERKVRSFLLFTHPRRAVEIVPD